MNDQGMTHDARCPEQAGEAGSGHLVTGIPEGKSHPLERDGSKGVMNMNGIHAKVGLVVFFAVVVLMGSSARFHASASSSKEVPVQGMVTMVDLGADKCIPCKMMAPILERLEEAYRGRAAIVFLDVWKDQAPAKRFGIRAIPTQIFFDEDGKEVYRHTGFMAEADIVAQLKKMGVH